MSETLTMWTLKSPSEYNRLLANGVLRGDGRRICHQDFRIPYRWMMAQMAERLPNCSGKKFPVWAWLNKPDLRMKGYYNISEPGVRIEFQVSQDQVLLSDFMSWSNFVLVRAYLFLEMDEVEGWEKRIAHTEKYLHDDLPISFQQEIRNSWTRIFDIETLNASEVHSPVERTQGVMEEIRLEQVVKVTHFRAR